MTHSLTTIARRLAFIRETEGPNRGAWVEFLQRFCGGQRGDSWCSQFASVVCDIAYHGQSPLRKSGRSMTRLTDARTKGLVVDIPQADDLFYFVHETGHAHHEGIVTDVFPLTGIAGNTSEDGRSSNGTGVFEHALSVSPSRIVFVRLPKVA
jgi:hypothetical protein